MKKENRIYLLLALAFIGYYVFRNLFSKPETLVSNVPEDIQENILTPDNPVNTETEELIGVTTNPTEVTDVTADQTTTCYTGCPSVQSVIVINGSCQENGLLDFPPPCAPPNNNVGINGLMEDEPDRVTGGVTPVPNTNNVVDNSVSGSGGLLGGTSGVNVGSGLNSVSDLNCGGSSLAGQVIATNSKPEPLPDVDNSISQTQLDSNMQVATNDLGTQGTMATALPFEESTIVDGSLINPYTNLPYAEDSGVVSATGLVNNENPQENIDNLTEVNQEALGIFDYNSGFANAYDNEVLVTTGTSHTATTTGLATTNTNR